MSTALSDKSLTFFVLPLFTQESAGGGAFTGTYIWNVLTGVVTCFADNIRKL